MEAQTNIFVGTLPNHIDDATFAGLFEGYGQIVSIHLNAPKGYGFVQFSSVDEAQRVINGLNGTVLDGKTIVVKFADKPKSSTAWGGGGVKVEGNAWGSPQAAGYMGAPAASSGSGPVSPNVFVGTLPNHLDEMTFRGVFEPFGQIVSLFLNAPKGYGFVSYSSVEEAQAAIHGMNGAELGGKQIVVKFKSESPTGGGGVEGNQWGAGVPVPPRNLPPPAEVAPHPNVFVGTLPNNIDDATFRGLFDGVGYVVSIHLNAPKGYGFVQFSSAEEAQMAINTLNGAEIGGKTIVVKFADKSKSSTAWAGGGETAMQPWGSPANGPPSSEVTPHPNVFVGTLPTHIDEMTFRGLFDGLGHVVSIHLNAPKGYGFVQLSSVEEAQTVISSLNGTELAGRPIVVKFSDKSKGIGGGGEVWQQRAVTGPTPGMGVTVPPPAASGVASQDPTKLYVKGLPPGMSEELIQQVFSQYGQVVDSRVLTSSGVSEDGQGMTVAFVRMALPDQAAWLVQNLNGNIPEGLTSPLQIRLADNKGPKGDGKGSANNRYSPYEGGAAVAQMTPVPPRVPPPSPAPAKQWQNTGQAWGAQQQAWGAQQQQVVPYQSGSGQGDMLVPGIDVRISQAGANSKLYVKGLPMHADDLYMYKVFAPFGMVLSAKALNKETFVIGFVTYSSDQEAQVAINNLNGQTLLDGNVLSVSVKTVKY